MSSVFPTVPTGSNEPLTLADIVQRALGGGWLSNHLKIEVQEIADNGDACIARTAWWVNHVGGPDFSQDPCLAGTPTWLAELTARLAAFPRIGLESKCDAFSYESLVLPPVSRRLFAAAATGMWMESPRSRLPALQVTGQVFYLDDRNEPRDILRFTAVVRKMVASR